MSANEPARARATSFETPPEPAIGPRFARTRLAAPQDEERARRAV